MRLDAHQHFWELANPFTDWPTPKIAAIHRDFGPKDLRGHLQHAGIDGTILVQAAPSIKETEYCLAIAGECDFVKGVVGWIDFDSDNALDQFEKLTSNSLLRGLRPMVESIAEPGWLLKPTFAPIFMAMAERNLPLDGLVLWHQIGDLATLAQRYSELRIVLDHGGKPPIASGGYETWAAAITKIAVHKNVHCKLSGLWTEAADDISVPIIRPWISHLLKSFGPARLMWGSDWPVLELAGHYGDWHAQCVSVLSHLDEVERAALFGGNGKQFYGID